MRREGKAGATQVQPPATGADQAEILATPPPAQKRRRRPASGTAAAAFEALQQAAAGWPPPPPTLRPSERKFWDAVMIARLPQQWAQVDLLHAINLARSLSDIELNRAAMLREGQLVKSPAGPRLNPRHALIETLNRRAMSLTRILQLHAVATIGDKREQGGVKGEAAAAAAVLKEHRPRPGADDVDALLARPRLQ